MTRKEKEIILNRELETILNKIPTKSLWANYEIVKEITHVIKAPFNYSKEGIIIKYKNKF